MIYKPKSNGVLTLPLDGGLVGLHVNQRWEIKISSSIYGHGKYYAEYKNITLKLSKEEIEMFFEKV